MAPFPVEGQGGLPENLGGEQTPEWSCVISWVRVPALESAGPKVRDGGCFRKGRGTVWVSRVSERRN